MQGSSDESVLTPKGIKQAEASAKMVGRLAFIFITSDHLTSVRFLQMRPALLMRHTQALCTGMLVTHSTTHSINHPLSQLESYSFDAAHTSPLQRAALTADYVWGSRQSPRYVDPVLREIDLYTFQVCVLFGGGREGERSTHRHTHTQNDMCACTQGLLKTEVQERYPNERAAWQRAPNDFVLCGDHYPVKCVCCVCCAISALLPLTFCLQ